MVLLECEREGGASVCGPGALSFVFGFGFVFGVLGFALLFTLHTPPHIHEELSLSG